MQAATATAKASDPLHILPAEIVLRILDYASSSTLALSLRLSKAWNAFILKHEDHIYSAKVERSPDVKLPDRYQEQVKSFSKYYEETQSWKELHKKQTLLRRNWEHIAPTTTESVIQIGNDPVWRFRPDFKRRFILSTSQRGGFRVTCMDTGECLWSLGRDTVRPYAHLEYNEVDGRGTAVWDRWGNSVEIWRTVLDGESERGVFEQVAVLDHDCETRGYQLSYDTLCVVSTEGHGFVYDLLRQPPTLTKKLDIEDDAVGHLDQNEDCVMYSLGKKGYHVHVKSTGQFLGAIEPWKCSSSNVYHINHPESEESDFSSLGLPSRSMAALAGHGLTGRGRHGPTTSVFPPKDPSKERLIRITVERGPALEEPTQAAIGVRAILQEDDWGAGMLSGNLMVGVSRGGRVIILPNWRDCLAAGNSNNSAKATTNFQQNASLVLCQPHEDRTNFDLGGWLSIRDNRVLFEICDRIYVLSLNDDGTLPTAGQCRHRPSYATISSSAPELAVPVSFMALYDDCLMHTYTTLGFRREDGHDDLAGVRRSVFPTKSVRVLSFAPDLHDGEMPSSEDFTTEDINKRQPRDLSNTLMQLIDLLQGEVEETE